MRSDATDSRIVLSGGSSSGSRRKRPPSHRIISKKAATPVASPQRACTMSPVLNQSVPSLAPFTILSAPSTRASE